MAGPKHLILYKPQGSMWVSYMDGVALYRMIMRADSGYHKADPVSPEEFYYLDRGLNVVYTIKEYRRHYDPNRI